MKVVLGAGESGVGAALLWKEKGFEVFVSEYGKIASAYKTELEAHQIPFEEGGHDVEKVLSADEIVKSPGIADKTPIMKAVLGKGIPVISEIELAGRYAQGSKCICITGSNGKTTTTMWTYDMLKRGGFDVSLAGNVGFSLARQVALDPHEYYVVELSSFQLDNMYAFRADVAMLLNITPDHLDRYNYDFNLYAEAKMRIMQNMQASDTFIYWAEDPYLAKAVPARAFDGIKKPFRNEDAARIFAPYCAVSELALPGSHNARNAMAAVMAAEAVGVPSEAIRESLRFFVNVPHRLEPVGELDGVLYINDSKGTNLDSTWYALDSMTKPTVLIIGGTDKGNDYTYIEQLVRDKVKAMVFLTTDLDKLRKFFSPIVPKIEEACSMDECVAKCRALAEAGDAVLLSPACASFDLFKNYEDRGDQFRAQVQKLISNH